MLESDKNNKRFNSLLQIIKRKGKFILVSISYSKFILFEPNFAHWISTWTRHENKFVSFSALLEVKNALLGKLKKSNSPKGVDLTPIFISKIYVKRLDHSEKGFQALSHFQRSSCTEHQMSTPQLLRRVPGRHYTCILQMALESNCPEK